jgi:GntR family transcriptional regulator / MocR family aminotransferase
VFEIDHARGGLAEQLATALRTAIGDGRLGAGTRLPASRDLAGELGVSRGLVVGVYEQLLAEGRLVARHGSGTFVSSGATAAPAPSAPAQPAPPAPLRPGIPDLARFPRQAWRRAYESALRSAADADLDYGDPGGAPRLRTELAAYLGRVRAAHVEPTGVLVTTGVAQGLALLAAALRADASTRAGTTRDASARDGGTRIGVEDPGSATIREHLRAAGLQPVPVPVDSAGLDVSALARTRVRAVLTTPAHQFPTGVVLAPERRTALLAWAARTGGLVIEDDYDAEFRYDRDPVGTLQGLAPHAVALVGSVSKALAPALRLGWLIGPARFMPALAAAKSAADNGGPVLEQLAFAQFVADGGYDRHLRGVRRLYRQRRDVAVAALAEHLPQARVTGVAAGMHLVVTLPPGVDDVALAERAAAQGIGALALSTTRVAGSGPPGLAIGYASATPDRLRDAIRALGELARAGASGAR